MEDRLLFFAARGATGEGATDIANILADAAIMGEKSNWQRGIQAYMDEGRSPEEAKKQAFIDNCIQVGWSAVGGALSGTVMGGGTAGIHAGVAHHQQTTNFPN